MFSKIVSLEEYRERLKKEETRVAWADFPPVFIFCPLGSAKEHERYDDAKKHGNNDAALQLVKDIVPKNKLEELRGIIGDSNAFILPVHAIEEFGTNKIPAAFAYYLAVNLNLELCGDIVQANKPQRTDKGHSTVCLNILFLMGMCNKDKNMLFWMTQLLWVEPWLRSEVT